jgi:hypothetical protein
MGQHRPRKNGIEGLNEIQWVRRKNSFLLQRRNLRPQRGVLGFPGGDLRARTLGFGPPLLTAFGRSGDLVLEAFDRGLERGRAGEAEVR